MSKNKRPTNQATYYAYLLRLRRVDNAGRPTWRISLEKPGNKTPIYFESLTAMCAYLAAKLSLEEEKGSKMNHEGDNQVV